MALEITVLALALAGATAGAEVQAIEQGQQTIQWAKDVDAEDLAECGVSFPISTTPSGPSVSFRYTHSANHAPVDVTIWRKPCDDDDAILFVTLAPTGSNAYFCGFDVVQYGLPARPGNVMLNAAATQQVCGNVSAKVTGWLHAVETRREFDHEDPFTVQSAQIQGSPIQVPAYNYSAYSGGTNPTPVVSLDDDFSGSWYHAGETVKNQGWFLEFSDDSHTPRHALAAWFTGNANGTALMWYTAHGSYQGNVATLKVYQTDNVTFGGNTGSTREVGTLKFTFNSCSTGTAEWQFQDGRTGTLPITRMIVEPDDCD